MLLNPTPITTDRLMYHKESRIFTAEASMLPEPSRAYDDACDLGYTLLSHRTGTEIVFVHTNTIRDREGDVLYDVYCPAPEDRVARRDNFLRGLVLHVFND